VEVPHFSTAAPQGATRRTFQPAFTNVLSIAAHRFISDVLDDVGDPGFSRLGGDDDNHGEGRGC